MNCAAQICWELPLPDDANLSAPLFFFARAIKLATSLAGTAGTAGLTIIINSGVLAAMAIGVKSLTTSYYSFGKSEGATAFEFW
jgi:hypothetical protein